MLQPSPLQLYLHIWLLLEFLLWCYYGICFNCWNFTHQSSSLFLSWSWTWLVIVIDKIVLEIALVLTFLGESFLFNKYFRGEKKKNTLAKCFLYEDEQLNMLRGVFKILIGTFDLSQTSLDFKKIFIYN